MNWGLAFSVAAGVIIAGLAVGLASGLLGKAA